MDVGLYAIIASPPLISGERLLKKPPLTVKLLQQEAHAFSNLESLHNEPSLYGATDGKRIGTYLEHKFQLHLQSKYEFVRGSSAMGIDFPELGVDIKVTRHTQPQSSCPFRSARQKIYGLGYSLLVFVYDKQDNVGSSTARLLILHTIFVEGRRTADFQTTSGLIRILENNANADDIRAFLEERMLPCDEIERERLTHEILSNPPELGYLTISNALQWRLQYARVIEKSGQVHGIERLT